MFSSSVLQLEANPIPPLIDLDSASPQLRDAQDYPVTAGDLQFVMDICARVEAESVMCRRMALRSLKRRRNQSGNLSRTFDIEADLENSLHLVECLPQGSRGADPPCEEFLRLSKAVMGRDVPPERILENALLFEEYALQLLSENDSRYESRHNRMTASPWLIVSDVEQRIPAQSRVALSWPDKWLARRMRRLLGAAPRPVQQRRVRISSDEPELREARRRGRPRKRKRSEGTCPDSDGMPEGIEDGCDSYSSDNYSVTSDE